MPKQRNHPHHHSGAERAGSEPARGMPPPEPIIFTRDPLDPRYFDPRRWTSGGRPGWYTSSRSGPVSIILALVIGLPLLFVLLSRVAQILGWGW